jgi:HlyD family type I secretion membrane fusion protein
MDNTKKGKLVEKEGSEQLNGKETLPQAKDQPITSTIDKIALYIDEAVKNKQVAAFLNKTVKNIDNAIDFIVYKESPTKERNPVLQATRSPIIFGAWVIFLMFGICGVWSAVAPLDSAVSARGKIVVGSNKKTIQHYEGGIIEQILVKDGDIVKKDQPLLILSSAATKSNSDALKSHYMTLQAQEARLHAEQDGADEVKFPQILLDNKGDSEISKIMNAQLQLFNTRKQATNGKISVLSKEIDQYKKQIDSLIAQSAASKEQLSLINEQIKAVTPLVESKEYSKPRLLELQGRAASLNGSIGEISGKMAQVRQLIAAKELEILNIKNMMLNDVAKEIKEVELHLSEIGPKFTSATDVLNRLVITAPQDGIIYDIKFHTIGGVIKQGEPILDIVPQDDQLIVEAQVNQQDIASIHKGSAARVRLSAFKARNTPPVVGTVMYVSPDLVQDRFRPEAYYVVRIEIEKTQFTRDPRLKKIELWPGMPAEVMIITGTRTFLRYLFDPFIDSVRNAFREK